MVKPSSRRPSRLGRPNLRTVIEQPRFVSESQALTNNAKRLDEAIDAVKWFVSRTPEDGVPVGNGVFAVPTMAWNTVPCVVYYSFDESEVYLESMTFAVSVEPT